MHKKLKDKEDPDFSFFKKINSKSKKVILLCIKKYKKNWSNSHKYSNDQ